MFLEAEDLIKKRLKAKISNCPEIISVQSLVTLEEDKQHLGHAIAVSFDGYQVEQQSQDGGSCILGMRWQVTTAVRNARFYRDGEGQRELAEGTIDSILAALLGHKLATGYRGLRIAESPGALYAEVYSYFVLTFVLPLNFTGSN